MPFEKNQSKRLPSTSDAPVTSGDIAARISVPGHREMPRTAGAWALIIPVGDATARVSMARNDFRMVADTPYPAPEVPGFGHAPSSFRTAGATRVPSTSIARISFAWGSEDAFI